MGSRTLPYECEHGKTIDWGDFGPDQDDGSVGAEHCAICDPSPDEQRASLVELFRKALMEAHHHDWTMETCAEAAHICARALVPESED